MDFIGILSALRDFLTKTPKYYIGFKSLRHKVSFPTYIDNLLLKTKAIAPIETEILLYQGSAQKIVANSGK